MRILIVGDTHGNPTWSMLSCEIARNKNVDAIFQVGDFGFLFKDEFLNHFSGASVPVYFIPGNHDNYEFLIDVGAHGHYEMVEVWDNIWHVPRCHVWNWDGKTFAACGGGFSVDQDARTTYVDYWPQEILTDKDWDTAIENTEKVDVFFSHDAPHGIPSLEEGLKYFNLSARIEIGSEANRMYLRKIVERFGPEILIHGHYHWYYEDELILTENENTSFPGKVKIIGLNCDNTYESMVILDTDTLGIQNVMPTDLVEAFENV